MTKPRLIFPGQRAARPQYVLGTKNGTVRTSNVTEEKIFEAVYDIDEHESVYLEKCVPIVLVRYFVQILPSCPAPRHDRVAMPESSP